MILTKLKAARESEKLTNQDVANKIGVSKEYYWMIENGQRKLSYEMAVKIANVFKKNPDDIFLQ